MTRAFRFFCFLIFLTGSFALLIPEQRNISGQVKDYYQLTLKDLAGRTREFESSLNSGNEKEIKRSFLRLREAYKKTEVFTEYFFPFYAGKLNGPPIPFFEESEPDLGEQAPVGMQVIEGLVFPKYEPSNLTLIRSEASEIKRYVLELPGINESFAFDDNNIFDAITEQLFRIASLGITGFDSQAAVNGLPESASALQSVKNVLNYYKIEFERYKPGFFEKTIHYLNNAINYLNKNGKDFNRFDRMFFILNYLEPATKLVAEYKTKKGYTDNPSGRFYSSVSKTGSLFDKAAFNPSRFLDDFSSSPAKIELGRKLFFEPSLSSNQQRSCASCHQPGKAFTDGLKTSLALDGHSPLPRNAPTIWNASLQRNLFYDSRGRNLEDQVLQVLNNNREMHGSAKEIAAFIIKQPNFRELYKIAYPDSRDELVTDNICNAIACYERTLISDNSKFDRHMRGQENLSNSEINGFNIFMGKAKCGTCHFMPLFSGAKPPRFYYMESEVLGVPQNKDKKNAALDKDSGRYLVTRAPLHLFSFKTPTLRNISLTAPYMHNGVFATLEEVIDFYNEGGGKGLGIAPANQSLPFDKLELSKKERKDLISFMKALTDTSGQR